MQVEEAYIFSGQVMATVAWIITAPASFLPLKPYVSLHDALSAVISRLSPRLLIYLGDDFAFNFRNLALVYIGQILLGFSQPAMFVCPFAHAFRDVVQV